MNLKNTNKSISSNFHQNSKLKKQIKNAAHEVSASQVSKIDPPRCVIPRHTINHNQGRLVIFPMSGNNTFETSDFADRRFSFRNRGGGLLSTTMFLWKKIFRNMKQMIIYFFFTKSFSLKNTNKSISVNFHQNSKPKNINKSISSNFHLDNMLKKLSSR